MSEKQIFSNTDIYNILKKEILELSLYPGQIIGENDVSKRFNVSRTPIREVFKRLEYDDLIKPIRNVGTMITPINLGNITDLMFVREKLEVGIIEDCITCIQEQDLVKLQLLIIKQRKLLEDKQKDIMTKSLEFYQLDTEFHKMFFIFANKLFVWETIVNLMPDYQRFRTISAEFHDISQLNSFFAYHVEIYEAVQEKDMERVRKLYSEHIFQGKVLFKPMIEAKEDFFVL